MPALIPTISWNFAAGCNPYPPTKFNPAQSIFSGLLWSAGFGFHLIVINFLF